mmetsp:Transcript_16451/g.47657  ORF Transcript_16451/g.47657 Transcript_16451/m.47657 type:complete len:229 (+) Transcript_16451:855-1541(+)
MGPPVLVAAHLRHRLVASAGLRPPQDSGDEHVEHGRARAVDGGHSAIFHQWLLLARWQRGDALQEYYHTLRSILVSTGPRDRRGGLVIDRCGLGGRRGWLRRKRDKPRAHGQDHARGADPALAPDPPLSEAPAAAVCHRGAGPIGVRIHLGWFSAAGRRAPRAEPLVRVPLVACRNVLRVSKLGREGAIVGRGRVEVVAVLGFVALELDAVHARFNGGLSGEHPGAWL